MQNEPRGQEARCEKSDHVNRKAGFQREEKKAVKHWQLVERREDDPRRARAQAH